MESRWMAKSILLVILIGTLAHAELIRVSPASSAPADAGVAVSLPQAVKLARQLIQQHRSAPVPITIQLEPGHYTYDAPLHLDATLSGSTDHPIRFTVRGGQKAIFNGGLTLDIHNAKPITDSKTLSRLSPLAAGKVYRLAVKDGKLQQLLNSPNVKLSMNGTMMNLCRYPNVGFAHIDRILDPGAIYAHGRTLGDPPTFAMNHPVGGVFTVRNKDISPWEREFQSVQKAQVDGYLAYDWYKQHHRVASIAAAKIKLLEYSRYGLLTREKIPRRFVISNLLCELDRPGEFYYDEKAAQLFLWPYHDRIDNAELTVWAGGPFLQLDNCSHIQFENMIVEGVSQGAAVVKLNNCTDVTLAGWTIRNCSRPAVIIEGGRQCGLVSCDIYDVPHHLTLSGGDTRKLIPAGHFARNCHFTQVQAGDFYGRIKIEGVGQIFQNNLVHNFIGQVMTVGGNDHRVENNEFFNIGIEEGDGGTIYSGAAMWSWGNVYRHNFLHHLMCIPQAHPRGGIYPDDRDQGDTITENIFYKAAHRAVLINGGAGHTVTSNLFLDCYIGIYNTDNGAESMFKMQAKYNQGLLKRGDKMDYIWRTEQVIGPQGWNHEPWKSHYPKFAKIMNQEKRRFWPIECTVHGNRFNNTVYPTQFLTKDARGSRLEIPFEQVSYFDAGDNRPIDRDIFSDPDRLDFSYKPQYRSNKDLPKVDFDNIGLYADSFRTNPPDKAVYRRKVKAHFKNRRSYDPAARYNPATINDMLYFNTGSLIMEMNHD